MLNVAKTSVNERFNHGILTTFGKLDTLDIQRVDGRPDQLIEALMKHYGWSLADARHRVDRFIHDVHHQ